MKSKYWLYGILALAIIGGTVISGCVQQQNNQKTETEAELIQISQNNFYYMGLSWVNGHLHNYENDPYWCYHNYLDFPLYDGATLKYKLMDIPKDYHKYIRCKVYDGSTLLTAKDYNGLLMSQWDNDPEDVRGFSVGLTLNEDHDLNICCRIYAGFSSDEPISNEVCFSQRVNKVECDRDLGWEERHKSIPKYFTE